MQLRESKPILIRSYCLAQREYADPKAAWTGGDIVDYFFFWLLGFWGYLEDAGVCIVIVLVSQSDVDMSVGPCIGPFHKCHCSHLANHAEQSHGT